MSYYANVIFHDYFKFLEMCGTRKYQSFVILDIFSTFFSENPYDPSSVYLVPLSSTPPTALRIRIHLFFLFRVDIYRQKWSYMHQKTAIPKLIC